MRRVRSQAPAMGMRHHSHSLDAPANSLAIRRAVVGHGCGNAPENLGWCHNHASGGGAHEVAEHCRVAWYGPSSPDGSTRPRPQPWDTGAGSAGPGVPEGLRGGRYRAGSAGPGVPEGLRGRAVPDRRPAAGRERGSPPRGDTPQPSQAARPPRPEAAVLRYMQRGEAHGATSLKTRGAALPLMLPRRPRNPARWPADRSPSRARCSRRASRRPRAIRAAGRSSDRWLCR
jgi:hypothetical protein